MIRSCYAKLAVAYAETAGSIAMIKALDYFPSNHVGSIAVQPASLEARPNEWVNKSSEGRTNTPGQLKWVHWPVELKFPQHVDSNAYFAHLKLSLKFQRSELQIGPSRSNVMRGPIRSRDETFVILEAWYISWQCIDCNRFKKVTLGDSISGLGCVAQSLWQSGYHLGQFLSSTMFHPPLKCHFGIPTAPPLQCNFGPRKPEWHSTSCMGKWHMTPKYRKRCINLHLSRELTLKGQLQPGIPNSANGGTGQLAWRDLICTA